MTIIYLLNSLVMVHKILFVKWNINFVFIKTQILSLSKNQLYLYRKSNFMIIKNRMISLIKYQILSLSKTKFSIYQKSKFIFIIIQILSLSKFYLIFAINYLDIFEQTKNINFNGNKIFIIYYNFFFQYQFQYKNTIKKLL